MRILVWIGGWIAVGVALAWVMEQIALPTWPVLLLIGGGAGAHAVLHQRRHS